MTATFATVMVTLARAPFAPHLIASALCGLAAVLAWTAHLNGAA